MLLPRWMLTTLLVLFICLILHLRKLYVYVVLLVIHVVKVTRYQLQVVTLSEPDLNSFLLNDWRCSSRSRRTPSPPSWRRWLAL